MKKTLALLIVIITLTFVFASCASLDSYKENLGADYKTDLYDYDEIEELADDFDIDKEVYEISAVMYAKDRSHGYYAYFIECGSGNQAEALVSELQDVVKLMNKYYSFTVEAIADSKYVLVGHSDVIRVALD